MLTNTDRVELQKTAKHFYEISKTMISFYDSEKVFICSYPNRMCDFCNEVRKSPVLAKRCFESDKSAFEQCLKSQSLTVYHCHMELLEVAAPILCNGAVIGYVMFGQITDQKDKAETLKKTIQEAHLFSVNSDELKKSLDSVRYRTQSYIEALSHLLKMCAGYVMMNNIISVRHDSTAYTLMKYITTHISEPLSVPSVCQRFNLSRSSLYKISQEHFGCGISDYIANQRIEAAKSLLTNETISITELAERVGFSDVNYFIRFFKKKVGMSPNKFRHS